MTEPEYNALPGLRATDLKAGATSMLHMRASITGAMRKESPALTRGVMVHAAILEPERFWQGVVTWKGGDKRSKEWAAFKAANVGKTILDPDETGELEAMIDSVYSKPEASELILGTEHEVLRQWTDPVYGSGKARLDGLGKQVWFDLKTARSVDARRFGSQFYGLGYDVQLGWYSLAPDVSALACYVIAVEATAPWDVVVYHVPSVVINAGREKAIEIARRYRACEALGVFPGADEGNGIVEFVPPVWAGGGEWTMGGEGDETTKEG